MHAPQTSAPSIVVSSAMTNLTGIGSASTSYGLEATGAPAAGGAVKVCPTCGSRYQTEYNICPRDGAQLAEEALDELVGKTLRDSYTIVRVVGEGGMGRVYEARHTRISSKRFAIKMLHPEYARQPDVLSRFQREAEAAATIKSPYVVDVYDVDRTADGRPFIVGEFLEGKEFADFLQQTGKMQVGPAVRVVRHVCKALAAAHAKGVVHRDMKPENVFLTGDLGRPNAKVIDFGISKVDDGPAGKALTRTGMIMGTPSYMAPEQARGAKVDHRADIYAVGAILYCAVTGQRPFDRGDPAGTLTAVLTEDPPRPRSIEPSIPEPLEMIIQRAMAKDPKDRYQSMADLDADLAPWEAGDADLAPRAGSSADVLAVGAGTGTGRASMLYRQQQEATMARPMISLLLALGIFWAAGSLLTTAAAVVRMLRGGGSTANLTATESVLMVLGVTLALASPIVFLIRHVKRTVWGNTIRAIELLGRIRRPVVVGLCAYGFGSLLVRLIESVLLRRAVGVAWPVWDILMLVIGASAAFAAHKLLEAERKATRVND
jgi:serine/threonine-protein kinase